MKKKFVPIFILIAVLSFAAISACKKSSQVSNNPDLPSVSTTGVSSVTATSATGGGNVTAQGFDSVIAKGVCWSTSAQPTISNNKTIDGSDIGSFVSNVFPLSSSTTYHIRAYATNSKGTAYGNDVSFTTSNTVTVDTTQPYITFDLDGVPQAFTGFSDLAIGGNPASTASTLGYPIWAKVSLGMPSNYISATDIQSIVGVKLKAQDYNTHDNINFGEIRVVIGSVQYASLKDINPFPANYVRFNTMHYLGTSSGRKHYMMTGEFTCKISYTSTVKNVTNGKFKLEFSESN